MSLYESWYFRAIHPSKQIGVWIRHTSLEDSLGRITGAHWFTLFTPTGVAARKRIFDGKPAVLSSHFAGEAEDSRWDVHVEGLAEPFEHLPHRWMYRAGWPRTKLVSVHPLASMRGEVVIGDTSIQLDGWRGMVGHNWGIEHAHRWIWIHAAGFDDEPDAWLDVSLARLKLRSRLTPWIANGALSLAGERYRIGGLWRRPKVSEEMGRATIAVAGNRLKLRIEIASPTSSASVTWPYFDPDGTEHFVANCSIASIRLKVSGRLQRSLTSDHSGAYELGMRDLPVGHPVQPYR